MQYLETGSKIPEMDELKDLYIDFVCDTITHDALDLFTRKEIVRHVAKGLFIKLRGFDNSPHQVSQRVARILKISVRTVDRYRVLID